ncbi:MAG: hypothetical protein QGI09_07415 [Dehalococcoidia bacterium]|nr:hypothetical protein [Dehalococcoidia bacterium]
MSTSVARYLEPEAVIDCVLCATEPQSIQHTRSNLFWTACSRYSVPLVVLKRHSGRPTAGEWRDMEVTAKARFPEYRWQRPFYDNEHFYFHAVDRRRTCNTDHTIAE